MSQAELRLLFPDMTIEQMGGACPWQAEGTLDGKPFYARYRGNQASLTVYEQDGETEQLCCVVWPYFEDERALDGWAGSLEGDEVVEFFRILIPALRPVSEENPSSRMLMAQQIEAALATREEGVPKALVVLDAVARPRKE